MPAHFIDLLRYKYLKENTKNVIKRKWKSTEYLQRHLQVSIRIMF